MADAKLGIRLETEDKIRLEKFAREKDLSISQVVRWAIREYLANHSDDKNIVDSLASKELD